MLATPFAGCCGYIIFSDFPGLHDAPKTKVDIKYNEDKIQFVKDWLSKNEKEYPGSAYGNAMIILNDKQFFHYNDILLERGYEEVTGPISNPNHKTWLFTYVKPLKDVVNERPMWTPAVVGGYQSINLPLSVREEDGKTIRKYA